MTTDSRNAIEQELDSHMPEGLENLKDEELTDFAERLHDARQRQSEALQRGIDEALEIVPRLGRGSVRKILFK